MSFQLSIPWSHFLLWFPWHHLEIEVPLKCCGVLVSSLCLDLFCDTDHLLSLVLFYFFSVSYKKTPKKNRNHHLCYLSCMVFMISVLPCTCIHYLHLGLGLTIFVSLKSAG